MWNDIQTGKYEGMIAETVVIEGLEATGYTHITPGRSAKGRTPA